MTQPADVLRSAMKPLLLVLAAVLLGGCRSTDPSCAGRTAADLTPSRPAFERMGAAERREAQRRLDETAARCGWEP